MEQMEKLLDAEFEVMQAMWTDEPPITTTEIMKQLGAGTGKNGNPVGCIVHMLICVACGNGAI